MEKFGGKYRVPSNRMPKWDYGGNGIYFITLLVQNRECVFGHIQNKQMVLNQWGDIAHDEWTESMNIRDELTLDAFVVMPNHLHAIVIIESRGDRRPDGLADAPDGRPAEASDGGLSGPREDGSIDVEDDGSQGAAGGGSQGAADDRSQDTCGGGPRDVGDNGAPDGANGGSQDATDGGSHGGVDGGLDVKTHGRASLRVNAQPPPPSHNRPTQPLSRRPKSLSSFIAGYKSSVTSQINNGIYNDPEMNLFPDLGKFNRRNRLWHPNYYDHIIRDLADYKRIKHYIRNNPANWKEDGFFPDED